MSRRSARRAMTLKLPGGGGGGNLSCDAQRVTLWTTAHRAELDARDGGAIRLVERCDFVTRSRPSGRRWKITRRISAIAAPARSGW